MVQRKDLLTFQFYKKERFTGSFCGMRYLIEKEGGEAGDLFAVYTWPGPYNFSVTAEEQKTKHTFPFAEESLQEIAVYLNEVYEKGKNRIFFD